MNIEDEAIPPRGPWKTRYCIDTYFTDSHVPRA